MSRGVLLNVRVPAELHNLLAMMAKDRSVTMSSLARELLSVNLQMQTKAAQQDVDAYERQRTKATKIIEALDGAFDRVKRAHAAGTYTKQQLADAYEKVELGVAENRDLIRAAAGQKKYRRMLDYPRMKVNALTAEAHHAGEAPLVSSVPRDDKGFRLDVVPAGTRGPNAAPRAMTRQNYEEATLPV
jgi:hypothetical protein